MKRSKIAVLLIVIFISVLSFLLLLILFQVPICEIVKNALTSIMISSIIAIPSIIIVLYNSSKYTNQSISELYMKLYLINRDDISQITSLNKKGINEIINKIVIVSQNIGELREKKIIDKKYDSDELTDLISDLVKLLREYSSVSEKELVDITEIHNKVEEINKHICETEGIVFKKE